MGLVIWIFGEPQNMIGGVWLSNLFVFVVLGETAPDAFAFCR